ncbi:MAG TPA: HAMP domain-containing sensor histidine kinase [Prolixibacteraceae bacterium]|nr:HAMP domain-containing sensor histidine kinase [Prolixibacteraceae bacterium]HPR84472.1 HAMP domain-containing sensor histidine kinase [Prolixibacteraceae bacterium]
MKNRIALKIALIYLIVGFIWILFSDRFILSLGGSANAVTALQTYKGWFFVLATACLLFFLIRREIVKKNKIEETLMVAKQKAEESDILKSAFLANMSHEIRTPLNGILGFCELLLDDSFSEEDKKIFAGNLMRNSNDFLKLINDIMDISKIQEKQYNIDKKTFNLNNLLNTLYKEYNQSDLKATRKKVNFKVICGRQKTEIELYSDPVRLIHVFRNLLNNAFFFTSEGYIHFGFEETARGIELFVEDSGCGIAEQNKELIFKPFFKGKNPIIGHRGFGLGLAISSGLIKLLGSNLNFTSEENKGSRFYFEIGNRDIVSRKPLSPNNGNSGVRVNSIGLNDILAQNKIIQN